MKEPKKIMLVSSSGGHWSQLQKLEPAFDGFKKIYVTTNHQYRQLVEGEKFVVVPDANLWNKFKLIWLAVVMLKYIIIIRPDFVVSTGAAPGFFAIFWGKIFGAKTVWLDSIANVEELSKSGKAVKRYTDLWLTQWEHLATEEGPNFYGAVI